ncbi:MAG: MFS transporter [Actinomycetota bacterium]
MIRGPLARLRDRRRDRQARSADGGGWRGTFSVFRIRNYRLFWFGGLTSNIGRWFQTIAIPIVVFDLTDSAGWVGFAGFAQIMPMALMGPFGGAIADRYPRRNVLLVTQTLQAFVALGLMVMWFGGVRTASAYVAMSVLVGTTAGLNLPAWQAIVSELVPRDKLMAGITLNSAQFNASRMVGPALGGAAIAWFGPGWAFFVNAISYAAVLSGLALMRLDVERRTPEGRMRPLHEFAGAARYAFARPGIRTAILTVSMIGFFGLSLQTLSVTIAEQTFDRGEQGFGLLLSFVGLGAVTMSPVIAGLAGRYPRSQIQQSALMLYAVGALVIAAAPVFVVALVGAYMMGAAHLTSASTLNTAIQLQVDEAVRAKVLAVYLSMLTAANPLGQLLLGQLIDRTNPRFAYAVTGGVFITIAGFLAAGGRLRGLDDEAGEVTEPYGGDVQPTAPSAPKRR